MDAMDLLRFRIEKEWNRIEVELLTQEHEGKILELPVDDDTTIEFKRWQVKELVAILKAAAEAIEFNSRIMEVLGFGGEANG